MECEYCGGELKPPKPIPDHEREMYTRVARGQNPNIRGTKVQNPTHTRTCGRCGRTYVGEGEGGPFMLLSPII